MRLVHTLLRKALATVKKRLILRYTRSVKIAGVLFVLKKLSRIIPILAVLALGSCTILSDEDAIIRSEQYPSVSRHLPLIMSQMIGADQLTLTSAPKFAGAISSMVFRGQEYINSADHGRLMQGAIAYNGRFECLNPTQGGGSRDSGNLGGRSTSVRGHSFVSPDGFMEVTTRMAYWLRPGMSCTIPGLVTNGGRSRVDNRSRLSGDVYKIIHNFGLNGRPHVVSVDISYSIARTYQSAVVEALTIYTPPQFNTFHAIDPQTGQMKLEPTITPDETTSPVILSTSDGSHAIAFVSLIPGATYARFRFPDTNKISLVYRDGDGITGINHYSAAWVIGTRDEVAGEVGTLLSNR